MPADPPAAAAGEMMAAAGLTSVASGTLDLSAVATEAGVSVNDQIALQDAGLRKMMSEGMLSLFGIANGVTLVVLVALVALDEFNLRFGLIQAQDRIIDHQVFMALLGATTVQVGTIAVIMARYLFPSR